MIEHNIIDNIYSVLETEIKYLILKPGAILSENNLCARFDVSRTPIRSVLQKLETHGLVTITSRKNTIVTLLNFDEITQTIYQRIAVESMVIRDFIYQCNTLDVEKIKYYLNMQIDLKNELISTKNPVLKPDNDIVKAFYDCDFKTHLVWFESTRKLFLWEQIQNTNASYNRFKYLDMLAEGNYDEIISEHTAILNAIENKDVHSIESLVQAHLNGGIRRLGEQIFTTYKHYFL